MQPGTTTCGRPELADDAQPVRSAVVDAAHERVGHLVGREVDDPAEPPLGASSSMAGPPTPLEWKTIVGEARLGQLVAQRHHRPGGVAQHRHRDGAPGRLPVSTGAGDASVLDHAGDGGGDVVEHQPGDVVEPQDVDHGVHDHHVPRPDERPELVPPRRDRRDDHLRDADRQPHQRTGRHDRALCAADADPAEDPAGAEQVLDVVREHRAHRRDCAPARPGRPQLLDRRPGVPGDLVARHVRDHVERRVEDPAVDDQGREAAARSASRR
jgi:hypothetical protein